jgi:Xaa-Pro aminopeptidase
MKVGWVLDVLLEFSGPDGYYNELARKICLGGASKKLEEVQADVLEAQSIMAKKLIPGAHPIDDVLKASNDFMREKGYPEEDRTAGHGQGYDLMERPAFSVLGETIRLKAGMVVSLHPTCHGKRYSGWISDDFLVTETGGIRIHRSPQEILVV